MRHRNTKLRVFVLQLYDRIEPTPDQSPTDFPSTVREVLQGHSLECPHCGAEPEFKRMEQDNHAQPVVSISGRTYGIQVGHTTVTLEAKCHPCNATITYNIDCNTGEPAATSVVTSFTSDRYLGGGPP